MLLGRLRAAGNRPDQPGKASPLIVAKSARQTLLGDAKLLEHLDERRRMPVEAEVPRVNDVVWVESGAIVGLRQDDGI